MIGAAFGLGFIVGPALGGWLGAIDPRLPFWVAGALSLLNAAYGFLVLPDRSRSSAARPFPFAVQILLVHLSCCVRIRNVRLSIIQFIGYTAHEVVQNYVLYAIFRYAWQEKTVGLSLAFVGTGSSLFPEEWSGRSLRKWANGGRSISDSSSAQRGWR